MAKHQYSKPLAELNRAQDEPETPEEGLAKLGAVSAELQKELDNEKSREESANTQAANDDLKEIWTEYGLPSPPDQSDIAGMSYVAQAAYWAKIAAAKAMDTARKTATALKYLALQATHDAMRKIAEAMCNTLAPAKNPNTPTVPKP